MIIAAIRQTSPGRLTVAVDTGEEIKSTLGVVTDMRLFSGKELDYEAFEELKAASERALARERALEILSRRPMSKKELRDKLIAKGIEENVSDYCVQWLEDNAFLDDESYAAALARHYAAKGYGPGRLRSEFSRRGIPREFWERATEAMPVSDDKLDRFIASRLSDPNDREQVRKISAALYRRGHSWDAIRSALQRYNASFEDNE